MMKGIEDVPCALNIYYTSRGIKWRYEPKRRICTFGENLQNGLRARRQTENLQLSVAKSLAKVM